MEIRAALAILFLTLTGASCTRLIDSLSSSARPLGKLSLQSLRSHAQLNGIKVGAAVSAHPLRADGRFVELMAREFGMLTPENSMKFSAVQPVRGSFAFNDADAVVQFAESKKMSIRGHTLVWHEQLPAWLVGGTWNRAELIDLLREHILTVVGRYRGRVTVWDVVNEAVDASGTLREGFWLKGIGPEYIDMAFRWAHEADPDAKLFYNDFGIEGGGIKSDGVYSLLKKRLQQGVPIHGVGLQMHVSTTRYPDPLRVGVNMRRMAGLGLVVHITEMDVRIKDPVSEDQLAIQARIYRDMLDICLAERACEAFVLWGVSDRYSWIPTFFPGWSGGLIFDADYRPKPAYYALLERLSIP